MATEPCGILGEKAHLSFCAKHLLSFSCISRIVPYFYKLPLKDNKLHVLCIYILHTSHCTFLSCLKAYNGFELSEYKKKVTGSYPERWLFYSRIYLPKLFKKYAFFLNNKIPTKNEWYGNLNALPRLASPVISVIEQSWINCYFP